MHAWIDYFWCEITRINYALPVVNKIKCHNSFCSFERVGFPRVNSVRPKTESLDSQLTLFHICILLEQSKIKRNDILMKWNNASLKLNNIYKTNSVPCHQTGSVLNYDFTEIILKFMFYLVSNTNGWALFPCIANYHHPTILYKP